jgi:hypothetical protein
MRSRRLALYVEVRTLRGELRYSNRKRQSDSRY